MTDSPEKRVWLKSLYSIIRILVIIAITGMILTSVLVVITGFAELFRILSFLLHDGLLSDEAGKFFSVTVTEMTALYLIGFIPIIFSIGPCQPLSIQISTFRNGWIPPPSIS